MRIVFTGVKLLDKISKIDLYTVLLLMVQKLFNNLTLKTPGKFSYPRSFMKRDCDQFHVATTSSFFAMIYLAWVIISTTDYRHPIIAFFQSYPKSFGRFGQISRMTQWKK
jgi:cytochrome b561